MSVRETAAAAVEGDDMVAGGEGGGRVGRGGRGRGRRRMRVMCRRLQSFHKKPSTQPRSIVPPICSSFRVNVAENQWRVNEQFSKALFCSSTSGAQTHEAAHDSNVPSIALSGPPHRGAGPFGHSGWSAIGGRARGHSSRWNFWSRRRARQPI